MARPICKSLVCGRLLDNPRTPSLEERANLLVDARPEVLSAVYIRVEQGAEWIAFRTPAVYQVTHTSP